MTIYFLANLCIFIGTYRENLDSIHGLYNNELYLNKKKGAFKKKAESKLYCFDL